jgi:hypothetical protein
MQASAGPLKGIAGENPVFTQSIPPYRIIFSRSPNQGKLIVGIVDGNDVLVGSVEEDSMEFRQALAWIL